MADVKVENKGPEQQRNQPAPARETGSALTPFENWPSPREFFLSPFSMMRRLSDEMDRAFSSSVGLGRQMGSWWPAMEVKEQDGNLVVSADLPGLNKDDVEIDDQNLVIRGERKREHEEKRGGWHRSERSYGQFYRTIPLPEGTKADQAQAQFKDGVLEVKVSVPAQTQRKSREIPIKSQ